MLFQMSHKLDTHIEHCDRQFEQGNLQFEKLTKCIESNTDAQTEYLQQLTKLADATTGAVQLEKDVKAVIKVGRGTQRFLLWIIKWPLILTGLMGVYQWFILHAPFK